MVMRGGERRKGKEGEERGRKGEMTLMHSWNRAVDWLRQAVILIATSRIFCNLLHCSIKAVK